MGMWPLGTFPGGMVGLSNFPKQRILQFYFADPQAIVQAILIEKVSKQIEYILNISLIKTVNFTEAEFLSSCLVPH